MKRKISFLLLTALIFTSCTDILIEDHVVGTWELKTYLRNGMDETSEVMILNYEETYGLDGTFARSYIDGNQSQVDETGEYSINEDNSSIHISDVSSISGFSTEHSTLSTSTVEVLSLDESEYAYTFENGGDTHEFRFIIKE